MGNCQGNGSYYATTTYGNNNLPAVGFYVQAPNVTYQIGYNQNNCSYTLPSSAHTGALLAGLGDGSVKVMAQGMSTTTFNLALIPNDGMPMPQDW